MKKIAYLLCTSAVFAPASAYAQSTGTVDFEKDTIVVTGTRAQDVGGVKVPDATKAKAVLTQEIIARGGPGQTVLDTINVVPGVSFQNNDAYGNSGGTLSIRGFDSTRISYTLDGIQLNDSGNYNIYSNFSIDPELIEQVAVNLGSTDVDSPTASAVGGTINQRSRNPGLKPGGLVRFSLGEFDYRRIFGMFDTGVLTSFGTRAYIAGSTSLYRNPFNNVGKVDRQQFNAKVYQPIGSNGDFISLAGRHNRDRNNFFGSVTLRDDLAVPSGFPQSREDREYDIAACHTDTPQAGVADTVNSCGMEFDRRQNFSDSDNLRGSSRFSITDRLVLTIDPSYQYTKARGGGLTSATNAAREYGYDIFDENGSASGGRSNCSTAAPSPNVVCVAGYFGGAPYVGGVDLNGDGDILDTVTLHVPSHTRTIRTAVVAGLRFDINDQHSVRATFTYDKSNHRQTGQVGYIDDLGNPIESFPADNPILDVNGFPLQKRDRQSYAILTQVGGEYRGEFGPLTVNAGARLPYFTRDLENYCFASSVNGFVECAGGNDAVNQEIEVRNPYTYNPETNAITGFAPPDHRVIKYSKLLPTLGLVYDLTNNASVFGSYTKNISVPSTDNLYNAFYFPAGTEQAKPEPETTDSFDAGLRYRSSKVQAQVAAWLTKFENRLASAYDPELERTVFRNLGRVEKWGFDGSLAYEPVRALTLYAFGSVLNSKIEDNIQIGSFGEITDCDNVADPTTANAIRSCAFTAGQREGGSPKYTYGFSGVGRAGLLELGVTAKRTGPRFIFDTNRPVFTGAIATPTEVFTATAPAYWLVNVDARYKLSMLKGLENSYVQLNVYNLLDKVYVGGFTADLNQATSGTNYGNPPFAQVGAPRTISGTLNIAF